MIYKLRKITRKITIITAIFAVVFLNFTAVVQCGYLLVNDDCCHIANSVKPCCVKNLKISFDERLTGHCGCSIKQSQHMPDMYADLSSAVQRNIASSQAVFAGNLYIPAAGFITEYFENYSPPESSGQGTYLANMNLRI